MKKLASITMEGNGLSMVVGNPKKNEDFALLFGAEAKSNLNFS
jgi:hypothetical protein